MVRIIIATILGAVVLFFWGFIAWTVLPLHKTSGWALTDDGPVSEALKQTALEDGVYYLPGMNIDPSDTTEEGQAAMEAWVERHKAGPTGFIVYHANGREPMDPMVFLKGFVINLVSVFFAAVLLSWARLDRFGKRVLFVLMLGLMMGAYVDLSYWNYFYFPVDFTAAMIIDKIVAWLAVGFVLALVLRPMKPATEA